MTHNLKLVAQRHKNFKIEVSGRMDLSLKAMGTQGPKYYKEVGAGILKFKSKVREEQKV